MSLLEPGAEHFGGGTISYLPLLMEGQGLTCQPLYGPHAVMCSNGNKILVQTQDKLVQTERPSASSVKNSLTQYTDNQGIRKLPVRGPASL